MHVGYAGHKRMLPKSLRGFAGAVGDEVGCSYSCVDATAYFAVIASSASCTWGYIYVPVTATPSN